jgi:hypothetical protein
VSHSVSHREFAPPLTLEAIQPGWYRELLGNRADTNGSSDIAEPFVRSC